MSLGIISNESQVVNLAYTKYGAVSLKGIII